MGCVLGTSVTGVDTRRKSYKNNNSSNAFPVNTKKKQKRQNRAGEFPAAEKLRPLSELRVKTGQGWPSWLTEVAGDAIKDWTPRRANTFEKLDKIGQGSYSSVFKARDLITGKIVALKKVSFDNLEPESIKFMAREILILKKLDHPNVIKLQGLVTSRMSNSLYLVFEYLDHDLAGLAAIQDNKFSEPQVKCFMKQLLSGLEHCHNNGVLHRDIKCSNLLIDSEGNLKIADFGLATLYDPGKKRPMTSRVVTLWYRPPELLLGATHYGIGVDLWSAGCILGELLAGKPIMPGRTEVEQLHKIFKLCGSPSDDYWKKSRLPKATAFRRQHPYKPCTAEALKDFPSSSLPLIETLLAIDPGERGSANAALNSKFFLTEPFACEPSSLPKYPPSKELDVRRRHEEAKRHRGLSAKAQAVQGTRKVPHDGMSRAVTASAKAELETSLDRRRVMTQAIGKSISVRFPSAHQDAAVGKPLDKSPSGPVSFGAAASSFKSTIYVPKLSRSVKDTGTRRMKSKKDHYTRRAQSQRFVGAFSPSLVNISMDPRFKNQQCV